MGYGLEAPAAIAVEVGASDNRVFRLSFAIGDEGLRLERPAPYEIGRDLRLQFWLPDARVPLALRARLETTGDPTEGGGEHGGCGLRFLSPDLATRAALTGYVLDRLGLPRR